MNIQVRTTSVLENQPMFNDEVKDAFTGLPGITVTTGHALSFRLALDHSSEIKGARQRGAGF
jgi:hypothetical protein